MDRLDRLRHLYDAIHRWAVEYDTEQVPRRVVLEALDSELVVIGQALGRDTQRLTGLPYTLPNGGLSGGGRALDDFLSRFGYSIDPTSNRQYAYSTDLLPRFPGRKPTGAGDLKPSSQEIVQCRHWLEEELRIIAPKVAVPLGAMAAREFLQRYAGVSARRLDDIAGQAHRCSVDGHERAVVPGYHPSGAWQFPTKAPRAFDAAADEIRRILSA